MRSGVIDIIIAVFNGEQFIEEAIASVQAQSWENFNIIIADDGSSDRTNEIVSKLQLTDKRISLLTLPHRGVSASLNAAIRFSTAEYIAFLDADDLWHEEKLERQMATLRANSVDICFCLIQEFQTEGQVKLQSHRARPEPLKGYSKIAFLGRRNLFDFYGLFDENVSIGDFVDWFSRIVRAERPVIMINEVLAYRRVHQNNTTRTVPKTAFLKLIKSHLDEKRKDSE